VWKPTRALLAVLYDIHANLPALEAAVSDARGEGATMFFLGGDYVGFGPFPKETLAFLDGLEETTIWIRGNGEKWLREPPADRPEVADNLKTNPHPFDDATVERLYRLPLRAEIDGVVFVHGCVVSDVDSFAREKQDADVLRCGGLVERTIVFGHSHLQFRRPGPNGNTLVNPGSVGMPLDRDTRAAWATWNGSDFELHRSEYDVERAVAAAEPLGEWGQMMIKRYTTASD
jgi:predicted phosphodiesterase